MAMGIALGVTVFATAAGAVGAMAAFGPVGPFVAIGIVVRLFEPLFTFAISYLDYTDRWRHRCYQRAWNAHRLRCQNKPYVSQC